MDASAIKCLPFPVPVAEVWEVRQVPFDTGTTQNQQLSCEGVGLDEALGDENESRMTRPTISRISPLFIVADVPATLSFYRDMLGFEITFRGPTPDDEFFGIVRRDGAMIMFKALGVISDGKEVVVEPVPNYNRQPAFSWDAYVDVPDPDALAAEFASRGVRFAVPLGDDGDDGLRGFVIEDIDGYGLFFGHVRT